MIYSCAYNKCSRVTCKRTYERKGTKDGHERIAFDILYEVAGNHLFLEKNVSIRTHGPDVEKLYKHTLRTYVFIDMYVRYAWGREINLLLDVRTSWLRHHYAIESPFE